MSLPPLTSLGGSPPRRLPAPLGPLDLKRFISTAELARLAGVSVSSIRRWRDEDPDFPPPRIFGDRTLRWSLGEVLTWLESCPRADGATWADEMDAAEREAALRRAQDEAAARRLDQPLVPLGERRR